MRACSAGGRERRSSACTVPALVSWSVCMCNVCCMEQRRPGRTRGSGVSYIISMWRHPQSQRNKIPKIRIHTNVPPRVPCTYSLHTQATKRVT